MVETQVTGRKDVDTDEEVKAVEEEEKVEEDTAERRTTVTGNQGMDGILKLMPEKPEVTFKSRHDGKLIATVTASSRNALNNPFVTRYVVKQAEKDYGRVAVEAASKTPATPTDKGDFTCTIRLSPTR